MKIMVPVMFEVTINDVDETRFDRSKIERMVRGEIAAIATDGESHTNMEINISSALDLDDIKSVRTKISLR